jgi:hypothetical protein
MTMQFRTLAASVETLLDTNSGGAYRVVGYPTRSASDDEVDDLNRLVQVFYQSGDFPKSAGSLTGPVIHDINFGLELTVSQAAEGDLATLDDPLSTPAQLQTALAGIKGAEFLANKSWDEGADLVWNVLMDAQNQGLGLDQNDVGSRWVGRFAKERPLRHGSIVVVTGIIDLSALVEEVITGAIPQPLLSIDMGVEVNGDDTQDPLAGTINDDFTP